FVFATPPWPRRGLSRLHQAHELLSINSTVFCKALGQTHDLAFMRDHQFPGAPMARISKFLALLLRDVLSDDLQYLRIVGHASVAVSGESEQVLRFNTGKANSKTINDRQVFGGGDVGCPSRRVIMIDRKASHRQTQSPGDHRVAGLVVGSSKAVTFRHCYSA